MLGEGPAGEKIKVDLPPAGKHGLIGRERELSALEQAVESSPVVLLTGPPGVGKTELALEYARRSADREARWRGVLSTSFEYGAGLSRVLLEIGTTLRGPRFSRFSLDEQRRRALDYLAHNPCLLVWDNFENCLLYLGESEWREIVDFLSDLAHGHSHVLITGRGGDWADKTGIKYHRVEIAGLEEAGVRHLASELLKGTGPASSPMVDVEAQGPDFASLLGLLKGNPVSMRAILPHLHRHPPALLSERLRQHAASAAVELEVADISLDCSYSLLSPRTRKHLPFVSLFRQRVLLDVLTFISQEDVYASVFGEKLGWGAWRGVLREARDCGILDSVTPSVYLIPPVAAGVLRRQLEGALDPDRVRILEGEFLRVYADMGDYFLEQLTESSDSSVTGVLAEEANLLEALTMAGAAGAWESAQLVLQPLAQVYRMQDRVHEMRRLRGRLLELLGPDPQDADRSGAVELWMYLQAIEVGDSIARSELDLAEESCQKVIAYLESSGLTQGPQAASAYHNLGLIAQGRGHDEEAGAMYRRALSINEPLQNEAECADSYHQMGLLARAQRMFDEAAEWLLKALRSREHLGDEAEAAAECYQLALVAEARQRPQDVSEWLHRSRVAYEHVGDSASAADVYHRLGMLAHGQLEYEEAVEWYRRALEGRDDPEEGGTGDRYQLGVIAQRRYEYEEAERWFLEALSGYESGEDHRNSAECCYQLGLAVHAQDRYSDAESWYQMALDAFLRLPDEVAAASAWGQLGLLADQQGNYPHAVWYVAHVYELALAHRLPVREKAEAHMAALGAKMGTEAFIQCWQEVSDTDVTAVLE